MKACYFFTILSKYLFVISCLVVPIFAQADISLAGSNSSNGRVFGLCFDDLDGDGAADPRISSSVDGGVSPVALAYFLDSSRTTLDNNFKNALKLFVADSKGRIKAFNWPESETEDRCALSPTEDPAYLYDAMTSSFGPDNPDGLSISITGQLYVLNSKEGNVSGELWRFDLKQSGLTAPVLLDANIAVETTGGLISSSLLDESMVLPGGDLLVVSRSPAAILRYDVNCISGPGPCAPETLITGGDLGGAPAGIALAPRPLDSRLMVSIENGTVEVFDLGPNHESTPVRQNTPFISGLNPGRFKIKTIRDIEENDSQIEQNYFGDIYLAGRNYGQIIKAEISQDGDSITAPTDEFGNYLYVSIDDVQYPVGLAVTDADAASTGECAAENGCNIVSVINHRIENAQITSGAIGETYAVYPDPRQICGGTKIPACPGEGEPGYDPGCDNSISLKDLNPGYDDVRIPGNLCGRPDIIVVDADSTAEITQEVVENTVYNGNLFPDIDCLSSDRARQQVIGWAPKADEDDIVEGAQVVDFTIGCGSSRQLTREFSYFLFGFSYNFTSDALGNNNKIKDDLQAAYVDVVMAEIANLRATYAEAATPTADNPLCIVDQYSEIDTLIAEIEYVADKEQFKFVVDGLEDLRDLLAGSPDLVSPKAAGCRKNYRGELRARVEHLWYNVNSKVLHKSWGDF